MKSLSLSSLARKIFLWLKSQQPHKSLDTVAVGTAAILSLHPTTAAIGGITGFIVMVWQKEQNQKFVDKAIRRLETIDKAKLDRQAWESDEFKELVLRAVDEAQKTASELKHQALVKVLASSVTMPASKSTSKRIFLRIISAISDNEMQVLTTLYTDEKISTPADGLPKISVKELKDKHGWPEQECVIACEGLLQLGLAIDPTIGSWDYLSPGGKAAHTYWAVTALGRQLVEFLQNGETEAVSDFL